MKSVFVNVFGGITACDAVANGIVQAFELLGAAAGTKPLVVRLDGNNAELGRRILADAKLPARGAGRHHGRRRATAPPSWRTRAEGLRKRHGYLPHREPKVIVQGMTGSEGMKHTQRMLASGTKIVGGVNPRKAGTTVDVDGVEVPVFGTVAEAMDKTGADVSVVFVPPAFTKAAALEAVDAGIALCVIITEGVPVHDTAEVWAYAKPSDRAAAPTRIIGPNCPGLITPGASNAGIIPADDHQGRQDRSGVQVGHPDLPDDVRAARLRLLHRGRHRRRPGDRHHPHRLPRRPSRTTRTPRRS